MNPNMSAMAFSRRMSCSMRRIGSSQLNHTRRISMRLPHVQRIHHFDNNNMNKNNIARHHQFLNNGSRFKSIATTDNENINNVEYESESDFEEQDFDIDYLLNHAKMCKDITTTTHHW